MAKKSKQRLRTRIEQNTFVRGLITEANPLTYPENASLDEENFILHKDGSRQRRLGLDYEDGFGSIIVPFIESSGSDIEHFLWKNAGSKQTIDISVLRIGTLFYFFDNNAEVVSDTPLNGGAAVTVLGFDPSGAGNPVIYDYAFINGRMFVVSGYGVVTVLSYDITADTVSDEIKSVSIRDTFGIYEDIDVDHRFPRPSGVPLDAHIYNLINQGWLDHTTVTDGVDLFEDFDSIAATAREGTIFALGINEYPSNADVMANFKISFNNTKPELIGTFNPDEMTKTTYGSQHAPKGHVIFDGMFTRGFYRQIATEDRSGRHTVGSPPSGWTDTAVENASLTAEHAGEATAGGFNAITSYAGRVIYTVYENGTTNSDDNTPALGDMIFFSQSSFGIDGLTRCYSELDPTSAEDFSPLDTDGGYITLSGIGSIHALKVLGNSLFVFADNGVWQINGGASLFSATNINVTKVTTIGSMGRKNIVVAEDKLYYITTAGLYAIVLSPDDPSRAATAIPISQDTIQQFLDDIPASSLENVVSYYDVFARQIKWLIARNVNPNRNYYDTELVLDLNLGAFYVSSFKELSSASVQTPYVLAYLERPSAIKLDVTDPVTHLTDPVEVLTDPVVITYREVDNNLPTSNKYWTGIKASDTTMVITVAEYKDLLFRDWATHTNDTGNPAPADKGEDAFGYLLTGYMTGGDSASNKRVTYITTHFRRTERIFISVPGGFEPDNPSSCLLTGQWEWTDSANAGRWSNRREIYRLPRTFIPDTGTFDYGHEVITTKSKLRGKGRALSLLFETSPLKDCHLYGWSYEINAEISV